jgi:SAM-dependent methyltransferase
VKDAPVAAADLYDSAYYRGMRGDQLLAEGGDEPLYDAFLALASDLPLTELRVLDLGCGRGELLALLRRRGVGGAVGADFSPAAVDMARERLARDGQPAGPGDVVCGSIHSADLFPPDSFDVIFMTDVVEHLPQPVLERGLANVRRWLKPGGRLVIHTFPTLGPHRLFNALYRIAGRGDELARHKAIHCNVQTRRSLHENVRRAGLDCVRMWLQNDFMLTSSAYQRLSSPALKRVVKLAINDWLGSRAARAALGAVGLAEFAAPSIYCFCTKA